MFGHKIQVGPIRNPNLQERDEISLLLNFSLGEHKPGTGWHPSCYIGLKNKASTEGEVGDEETMAGYHLNT